MSKEKLGKSPVDIQKKQDDWNDVHAQLQHVQKKSMSISSPEDEDEKEADTIARKVVSGEEQSPVSSESGGEMIHRSAEMALGKTEYVITFKDGETDMAGVENATVLNGIPVADIFAMRGGSQKYSQSVRDRISKQYGDGTPEAVKENYDLGSAACKEARERLETIYASLVGGTPPATSSYQPTLTDLARPEWGQPGTGLTPPFEEGRDVVRIFTFRPGR